MFVLLGTRAASGYDRLFSGSSDNELQPRENNLGF